MFRKFGVESFGMGTSMMLSLLFGDKGDFLPTRRTRLIDSNVESLDHLCLRHQLWFHDTEHILILNKNQIDNHHYFRIVVFYEFDSLEVLHVFI